MPTNASQFQSFSFAVVQNNVFSRMKVTQINSVRWKVKYFSPSTTKSSRAFRQYVKLNLPTVVTHTFASFQSNYGREHIGRVRGWPAARRKLRHGQRPQSGVWSGGRVPLNPVTWCSCSASLTRPSEERSDSLTGFRHIVAAK